MDLRVAYILHRYPYRETSFLLKVFTEEEGMITLVANNAKRPKSDWYGLLQPFQKLNIAYQGKGSVLSLKQAERLGPACFLKNRALWAGFYLNELLLKLLAPHDVHHDLFKAYEAVLAQIQTENMEQALRLFELTLFEEMGLLPDFTLDETGAALEPNVCYQLERQHLPRKVTPNGSSLPQYFLGQELLCLHQKKLDSPEALKVAKRFTRLWLEFYGMGRELHTREIFAEVLAR